MVQPLGECGVSLPLQGQNSWLMCKVALGATSHTTLRACDQYTSSTLIAGIAGIGPSLLPSHYA